MGASVGGQQVDAQQLLAGSEPISDADFELIYRRYKGLLVHYARQSSDPEGIADLALLDGYRVINRFDGRNEKAFVAYLKRAAFSHISDDYHRKSAVPVDVEDDVADGDPVEALLDQMWVQELLDQLSPDQRAVIESRFLEDLDGAETAARLGKDPNAIYQLQHRAIQRLRRLIFAAVFVLAAIIGIAVIRQATSSDVNVDSEPVEQPDTTTEVQVDEESSVGQDEFDGQETLDSEDEVGLVEAEDQNSDDNPTETAPTTTLSAAPAQANQSQVEPTTPIAGPETTLPPEPAETEAEPAATTEVGPDQTLVPPDAFVVIFPNRCEAQSLGSTMTAFLFYDPEGNAARVAMFEPPEAVRFLDDAGTTLHVVDTSGPMSNGNGPNSHGWLDNNDPSSTFADHGAVPGEASWGVLTPPGAVAGWTSVEFRIDSINWVDPGLRC